MGMGSCGRHSSFSGFVQGGTSSATKLQSQAPLQLGAATCPSSDQYGVDISLGGPFGESEWEQNHDMVTLMIKVTFGDGRNLPY